MPDASPTKWHLAPHELVLRDVRAGAARGRVRAVRPALRVPLQLVLRGRRRPRLARARAACCRARRSPRCSPTARHVDDAHGAARSRPARSRDAAARARSSSACTTSSSTRSYPHGHQARARREPAAARLPRRARRQRASAGGARRRSRWSRGFGEGLALRSATTATASRSTTKGRATGASCAAFALGERPVTCGEYLAFIDDGGYGAPELWLSDGWRAVPERAAGARRSTGSARRRSGRVYTLAGMRARRRDEAVVHVSYYEADAFARWAGMRLPTEDEWERAAQDAAVPRGHFADPGGCIPGPARRRACSATCGSGRRAPTRPTPAIVRPPAPSANTTASSCRNQMVLRGGSCLTPAGHVRAELPQLLPAGGALAGERHPARA